MPPRRNASRRTGARKAAKRAPIAVPQPWSVDPGGKRISVRLKTKDFLQAMDVLRDVAKVAEELEHHPDLHLERWNHLRITTYSHDVGHLTQRDARLAKRITALLKERGLV